MKDNILIAFSVAFSAAIMYVIAAPLTVHISMDLTQTHWANAWTYVFWLLGFPIWLLLLLVGMIAAAVFFALINFFLEGLRW